MTKKQLYTLAGITIAVLIVAGTSIVTIGTGKVGVVTNFGRVTGRELGEGISMKLPLGVESVSVYDIKVQKETTATAAATKDLQDVSAEVVLNFHLNRGDVSKIHQEVGVLYKDKLISPALHEVFKSSAAKYNAGELITERASLKNDVYTQLKERLEKYGIVVDDLSITDFKFSESFGKAIEDKQVAQQNAERAAFLDGCRWLAYLRAWNKDVHQPDFGRIQGELTTARTIYQHNAVDQVVVMVETDVK